MKIINFRITDKAEELNQEASNLDNSVQADMIEQVDSQRIDGLIPSDIDRDSKGFLILTMLSLIAIESMPSI